MGERFISKEVAVAKRMVRRRFRRASGSRASRDTDRVEIGLHDAELQKRHDREKKRRREAAGMSDMSRRVGEMLGKRASELRQ